MRPLHECRLYAFVDTTYLGGRAPEFVAQQLCDGGADLIQLRAKESPPNEIRRLAEAILPVTRQAGIGLVINDYPTLAHEVGAEFCHLGQVDFFGAGYTHVSQLTEAMNSRRAPGGMHQVRGPHVKFGLSTRTTEEAGLAVAAGAEYLGVGPVYPTGTKPSAQPVKLEYVRWAAANLRLPWFAIGGITLDNLDDVLASGAQRICVVSAILCAADPAAACRKFKDRLGGAPASSVKLSRP